MSAMSMTRTARGSNWMMNNVKTEAHELERAGGEQPGQAHQNGDGRGGLGSARAPRAAVDAPTTAPVRATAQRSEPELRTMRGGARRSRPRGRSRAHAGRVCSQCRNSALARHPAYPWHPVLRPNLMRLPWPETQYRLPIALPGRGNAVASAADERIAGAG